MFCSQCGAEASGNYCWRCGAALGEGDDPSPATPAVASAPAPSTPPPAGLDWSAETRYDALVAIPEVRARIARNADLSPKRMTGEQFLAIADKVSGIPLPVAAVAELIQPFYDELGVRTGKTRVERVPWPVGRVLVAVLCSLGRRGMKIRSVRQADDGCTLEAAIPSDLRSSAGTLVVTVGRADGATDVEAATKIGGQMFDWGKSARCLRDLFADVGELAPSDVVA